MYDRYRIKIYQFDEKVFDTGLVPDLDTGMAKMFGYIQKVQPPRASIPRPTPPGSRRRRKK
jgi:hypothetical protein